MQVRSSGGSQETAGSIFRAEIGDIILSFALFTLTKRSEFVLKEGHVPGPHAKKHKRNDALTSSEKMLMMFP
jgi:hypothetical protein